jgi:hypothetical protein
MDIKEFTEASDGKSIAKVLFACIYEKLSTVITLLSILIYADLFLSSYIFYGTFGIKPSDVGVSYGQLLSQAAVGLMLTGVVSSLSILIAFVLSRIALPGLPRGFLVVLAIATLIISFPLKSWITAREAVNKPIPHTTIMKQLLNGTTISLSAFHADPVRVFWRKQNLPAGFDPEQHTCLLYLGHLDGIVVLYDLRSKIPLRLPVDALFVVGYKEYDPQCPKRG